jgi:hypothetical protein
MEFLPQSIYFFRRPVRMINRGNIEREVAPAIDVSSLCSSGCQRIDEDTKQPRDGSFRQF